MPSTKKTLHFMSSALATAISVGVLGFCMSIRWAKTTVDCASGNNTFFNGSATLNLDLFEGVLERSFCPFFLPEATFQVIPTLASIGGVNVVLHALAVLLLVLCLLFSALSILISLYNSVSNPYETYMGPIGIYVCSSLSACLSFLVLILFVVNVQVTQITEKLVKKLANNLEVAVRDESSQMQLGYYLVIPYTVLSLVAILLIYLYDHAAYTHRREQQRPTEDAPKEIMMY
ncbi:clarin-3 [Acanthopagrus latus]|uniref:clarin-3 n=1 Tax=Acanthopagrus latus TaxID=8177 RepID=UPI00187CAA85|nr:clarin-3 [Acanthopagrus latus]